MELGARTRREGKVIDLAVYGGSALLLASNFRIATQDVDAVLEEDQGMVARWAEEVARTRNWPRDWLNDGVRTYSESTGGRPAGAPRAVPRLPVGAGTRLACLCAESGIYARDEAHGDAA